MCDIETISREKDELFRDVDKTLAISGAVVMEVKESMKKLMRESERNSRELALLL